MAFEQIRMGRTLSRLELGLAAMLLAFCFTWFLARMNYMTALAEAAMLDLTLRNIRTGVMGGVAASILGSDYARLAAMDRGNPVGEAIEPPAGYIGAVSGVNPASIEPGQWYFDQDAGWLVYHVVNTDYFGHGQSGPARVRCQLQLEYADLDGNGAFSWDADRFEGISLVVLDSVDWKFRN